MGVGHLEFVGKNVAGLDKAVFSTDLAADQLAAPGIRVSELNDRQNFLLQNPPRIVVPVLETEQLDALQEAGGNVRFTVYPGVGHDSWTQTYENPALYEWFLQHSRGDSLP